MTLEQREKKNERIAMATSISVHAILFIGFLFAVAWRAPDPPLPEVGIELNFGLDTQGSGDVQPETPVGTQEQADQNEEVKSEKQEEVVSEVKPTESKTTEQVVTTTKESPVSVKDEKKEQPKVKVEAKPNVKETPKKEEKAIYKAGEKTETKTGQSGNQGDDTGKTGDKGDPKGSLDAKALYGKQGGGEGGAPSLELAGWKWDEIPKPNVPNNESGRIVFEIKVDGSGEIISIKTLERSVSLEAEKICRREIEKLTFTKTGANVPAQSTGKITFVVRSK